MLYKLTWKSNVAKTALGDWMNASAKEMQAAGATWQSCNFHTNNDTFVYTETWK